MKTFIISLFALFTITVYSQQNFQGKAIYKSKTTMNMDFGGRQLSADQKKRIAERMKGFLEKTYVLNFNKTTSTYKEEESLETPGQGQGGRFGGFMSSFSGGLKYKNTKDEEVLEETEFFGKKFLISEESAKPVWVLGSETKKIGNYTCFKATLTKKINPSSFSSFRRGRSNNNNESKKDSVKVELPKEMVVTAWYTPQIPVSQGPAEYWGLPGLILEINAGKTIILCSEIVMNPSEKELIKKPNKGKRVTREQYDKIVKKKISEMRTQFRGRGNRNRGSRH
ncbi:MAG: GLPGLI family protein [Polaribacter sp.]|nr:GLPGLI family protein [Polaribacter sp.]